MPLGDVVKGTPYEKDRATGPGLDDRIAAMDRLGVDIEAVSVNDFWWWEIKDQGLARAICNKHNETLAAWCKQHPDRFVAMASIPLQFPDVAVQMLEDATKRLGARGVAVGSTTERVGVRVTVGVNAAIADWRVLCTMMATNNTTTTAVKASARISTSGFHPPAEDLARGRPCSAARNEHPPFPSCARIPRRQHLPGGLHRTIKPRTTHRRR